MAEPIPAELLAAMQKDDADFERETGPETAKPKPKASVRKPPASSSRRAANLGILEEKLTEHFIGLSMMVSVFDDFDGAVIATNSPRLAAAYTKLAAENPKVKKALEGMMEASAWGEVVIATTMTVVPIMKHHGVNISIPIPGRKDDVASSDDADTVG